MLTPAKIDQVLTQAQAVLERFDTNDPELPAKVAATQAEAKGAFALIGLGRVVTLFQHFLLKKSHPVAFEFLAFH